MKSLSTYPHIDFRREAVSNRTKETKAILTKLTLLANHDDQEHRLYKDDETGDYWQYASAWNWGAKPYCFLVPSIETAEWQMERYVDPDELLIFVAAMGQYLSVPSNRSIPNLATHMRMLQQIGTLPKKPEGRWFGPYEEKNVVPPQLRI
jgi:hypothetical protein